MLLKISNNMKYANVDCSGLSYIRHILYNWLVPMDTCMVGQVSILVYFVALHVYKEDHVINFIIIIILLLWYLFHCIYMFILYAPFIVLNSENTIYGIYTKIYCRFIVSLKIYNE